MDAGPGRCFWPRPRRGEWPLRERFGEFDLKVLQNGGIGKSRRADFDVIPLLKLAAIEKF